MIEGTRQIHAHATGASLERSGIVEVLRADHALLTALFECFTAVAKSEELCSILDQLTRCICDTLSIQFRAEEEVLYPEIRKQDDKLVFALLLANEGISKRIAGIRDRAAPKRARDMAVHALIDMARRYMVEREQVLLPFLRSRFSAARMQSLGICFAQRKLLHATGNATDGAKASDDAEEAAAIFADAANSLLAWRVRSAREVARR